MITLVRGKRNSGKSRFAENLAVRSTLPQRYYIATMMVMDEDSMARREEHRRERAGLDFETLEIPCLVEAAPELMRSPEKSVVLLECMANLVGNIMHGDEWRGRIDEADSESGDEFVRLIIKRVRDLAGRVGHLIVVTSDYEKEGTDAETSLYIELLDAVNSRLSRIADTVYTEEDFKEDKA